MDARWISFREGAWTSFGAQLPASLPVGRGWRGGHVRGVEAIDALDALVDQIAEKAGAAIGVWRAETFVYGLAAAADAEPVPFLLDVDLQDPPASAAEAIARCGVGTSVTGWRQRTAQALSTWSVHAPRAGDALEMDAALQLTGGEIDVVETWCRTARHGRARRSRARCGRRRRSGTRGADPCRGAPTPTPVDRRQLVAPRRRPRSPAGRQGRRAGRRSPARSPPATTPARPRAACRSGRSSGSDG